MHLWFYWLLCCLYFEFHSFSNNDVLDMRCNVWFEMYIFHFVSAIQKHFWLLCGAISWSVVINYIRFWFIQHQKIEKSILSKPILYVYECMWLSILKPYDELDKFVIYVSHSSIRLLHTIRMLALLSYMYHVIETCFIYNLFFLLLSFFVFVCFVWFHSQWNKTF